MYDAVDRPIDSSVTKAGKTTAVSYMYSGFSDNATAVLSGTTIAQRLIELPGDAQIALNADGSQLWSYSDLHGNIVATTDGQAKLAHTATYNPWGATTNGAQLADLSGGQYQGAFGKSGRLTDPASHLILLGARAFNPDEARFTSVDPVEGGCANTYTYAFGDPVNSSDISGRNSCVDDGPSLLDLISGALLFFGVEELLGELTLFDTARDEATKFAIEKVLEYGSEEPEGTVFVSVNPVVAQEQAREELAELYVQGKLPVDLRAGSPYEIGYWKWREDCDEVGIGHLWNDD